MDESGNRPQPTRKDFEQLIYKQLNSQHSQIRDAFKEMVTMITDANSAREALEALKDPIKKDTAIIQLKGLSILAACVKNCGHEFHVELATKKWMDRLIKLVRISRDDRVRDKILQLLVDWANQFQNQSQLQEFSIALHRLRVKGIELPPPSEKKERRKPKRPETSATNAGAGQAGSRTRNADPKLTQNMAAIDVMISNIQADVSNLELGLQRPELLHDGIANECRRHLQKIQVILSTELPDSATYEFIAISDQLHELLGLYDALFTDSAPEELALEREANEMRQIEKDMETERNLKEQKERELESLKEQLHQVQAELQHTIEQARRTALAAPKSEQERRMHSTLTDVISHAVNIRQCATDIKAMLGEEKIKIMQNNQKFLVDLERTLNEFPTLVERAKLGETKAFVTLKKLYSNEVATRKKLYNKLQELRGNIRVYCRVRPLGSKEIQNKSEMCVTFPSEGEIIIKEGGKQRAYEFDLVFTPESKQDEIFEDTKPLINCVVDGYKVCIFAYGQTGSGKTFTMQGPHENPGINRRAIHRLFELIEERAEIEKSVVNVSVLEIYNENIRDLLNENSSDKIKYEIKTHPIDGQYVEHLRSVVVSAPGEIDSLMAQAENNRSVGRTNMNEHSSRSHMLLYIVVRTTNLQSGVTTVGKLSLVDLAGSERVGKSGATGDRMKEAQCINKSLSALGDVISSLSRNDSHIPYRNSKLTHLLKDSLGGNSKCLMFVNISPANINSNESNQSLAFAFRARGVVLGPAKKNIQAPPSAD